MIQQCFAVAHLGIRKPAYGKSSKMTHATDFTLLKLSIRVTEKFKMQTLHRLDLRKI